MGGVGAHAGAGGTAEEEEERAGRAALRKEVEEAAGVLPPLPARPAAAARAVPVRRGDNE